MGKKSAVTLQAAWRRRHAMKKFAEDKQKVIVTQAAVRSFLARKQLMRLQRKELERTSATTIQAYLRGYWTRRKYTDQRLATLKLQTYWRATQLARRERHNYLTLQRTAVLLQSVWRG